MPSPLVSPEPMIFQLGSRKATAPWWTMLPPSTCQNQVVPSVFWNSTSLKLAPLSAWLVRPSAALLATCEIAPLSVGTRPYISGCSSSILFRFTVVQSSFRMPPVSPEFGFHAHQDQLGPSSPASIFNCVVSPPRYLVMASAQSTSLGSDSLEPHSPTQIGAISCS